MFEKLNSYVRDVRAEMRKVAWSPRQELINSTSVVLTLVAIVTVYIFAVDTGVGFIIMNMLFKR